MKCRLDMWRGIHRDECSDRINQFINTIDHGALLSFPSGLRKTQSCTVSPKFSVGTNNLVWKIQLEDGVEWIARLLMPPMPV